MLTKNDLGSSKKSDVFYYYGEPSVHWILTLTARELILASFKPILELCSEFLFTEVRIFSRLVSDVKGVRYSTLSNKRHVTFINFG